MRTSILTLAMVCACCGAAPGQSLFVQPEQSSAPHALPEVAPDSAAPLYEVSMFAVQPPKPKKSKIHELITIVVDESSQQLADQESKTDKQYNLQNQLNSVIDPWALLELRLDPSNTKNLSLIDIASKQKFDGKGNYTRSDKLSMKIEAEIIDVKPNGTLVLEARKLVDKNGENQTTILSGSCRQEDITANNSVFSSQLANLTLVTKNTGQVNDSGKKGLIPRVLETVFSF
jgi:flagellar L-ring protein precursor FlgH